MTTPSRFYEHINPEINRSFFDLNPDKPAVWKVYNLYFRILIEQRYTVDEREIEHFGVLSTGHEELDELDLKRPTLQQRTIADIANLVSRGIDFSLCDWEQSVIIYELIAETLRCILVAASESIHYDTKDYPMEEIRLLDELATYIWPKAKFYYVNNPRQEGSIIASLPQRISSQRRLLSPERNILGGNSQPQVPIQVPERHQPLAPLIASKLKLRS